MAVRGRRADARGMTSSTSVSPAPPARVAASRAPAPDVARGLALLGVTVVNAALLAPHAPASALDRAGAALVTLLLENRSWPMFAVMFGFGIAAIAARLDAQDVAPRRRDAVLLRRCAWLFVFGLLQAALFFWADILAVYAITGCVVIALRRRSGRVLAWFGSVSAALWLLGNVVLALDPSGDAVPASADYLASVGERLGVFAFWTGSNALFLTHLAPMLVGVALHRADALTRPWRRLRLLRRLAVGGVALGLAGALPLVLIVTGAWQAPPEAEAVAVGLHALTGMAQGTGYVALVALWCARRAPGGDPWGSTPIAAIGRRSLTVYLAHSLLLGLTLSPWALDLGPALSAGGTYAVGAAVWIVCAALALALAAAGRPGPMDALLRRLAYGRPADPPRTDHGGRDAR